MNSTTFISFAAICFSAICLATDSVSTIFAFSAAPLGSESIPGWTPIYLPKIKKHTRFLIVEDEGQRVLKVEVSASAASLAHALRLDPTAHPILRWRWKIPGHNPKTDLRKKGGDDYPARLYVTFDYDIKKLSFMDRAKIRLARMIYGEQVPAAALCYVWDPSLPSGTTAWNAYTNRVRMVVVRSGDDHLGQWMSEERNVHEDFKAAFGEDPPAISAIIVAGDGDNTQAASVAYFGDITLSPK